MQSMLCLMRCIRTIKATQTEKLPAIAINVAKTLSTFTFMIPVQYMGDFTIHIHINTFQCVLYCCPVSCFTFFILTYFTSIYILMKNDIVKFIIYSSLTFIHFNCTESDSCYLNFLALLLRQ